MTTIAHPDENFIRTREVCCGTRHNARVLRCVYCRYAPNERYAAQDAIAPLSWSTETLG